MIKRVYFLILLFVFNNIQCKKFESRCKLVRELVKVGMPVDSFFAQWVCLVEKVSNKDTNKLTVKSHRRKAYGIFQIPNRWCKEGRRGGDCNIACEKLLDDDIADDAECARTIFEREGFKYWPIWMTRCRDITFYSREVYKCPDLSRYPRPPSRTGTSPKRN